ncbi:MAG: DUF4339 domain-containing protein [Ignavibacteriae bacterium]|nr:DUF4339 domain-containing protein [Ignavibacteriota bacterium]
MKKYYLAQKGERLGPFLLEELKNKNIDAKTHVWEESFTQWKMAKDIPELETLILEKTPPPIPDTAKQIKYNSNSEKLNFSREESINSESNTVDFSSNANNHDYNYAEVEQISGVDYKIGMIITGILLALNILWIEFPTSYLIFGMVVITTLSVISWYYFRTYFKSKHDVFTSKMILLFMFSHIVFFASYLYASVIDWQMLVGTSFIEILGLLFKDKETSAIPPEFERLMFHMMISLILSGIAIIMIFVAGIRLLVVNRRYKLPLKRIAFTSMIFLPFLYSNYFSVGIFRESNPTEILRIILNLPFIFLLHHFYRAETEDKNKQQK